MIGGAPHSNHTATASGQPTENTASFRTWKFQRVNNDQNNLYDIGTASAAR